MDVKPDVVLDMFTEEQGIHIEPRAKQLNDISGQVLDQE
jgi:hypothetical protein